MKSADPHRRFFRAPTAFRPLNRGGKGGSFAAPIFVGVVLVGFASPSRAAPNLPVPSTHVADYASVIDAATRQNLDLWLTELEQKTGAQVIALTITSLGDEPIESFTRDVAQNKWKLGQKGKDNGVLICVAVNDRKYRIEVGYGLEGALPDSWCGSVAREFFVPNFRRGHFGEGILQGTLAVATKVAKEYNVTVTGMPQRTVSNARSHGDPGLPLAIGFFIVIFVLKAIFNRPRRYRRRASVWEGMILGNMLSGGRSSSWSSGRSSGGSFGGGGGGSFGGGGASGGW